MRTRAHCEDGASLIEYMLLVVLIAIVALLAVVFTGEEVSELWSETGSGLDTAGVTQVTPTTTTPPPVVRKPGS
ncbi:MAG: Flp family type IVb pilin [Acidimicrobiia bacterium]